MKIVPVIFALAACTTSPQAQSTETTVETVQFSNGEVTLEGDLTFPAGIGKVPLIVFVHGSGRADRTEGNYYARPLHVAGFGTFSYDKRGVGRSGGQFTEVGTWNSEERIPLLASDAAAAIRTLRNHPRVDADKVIVMGGSQAGWIIPVVADMEDVLCTVIISGPTVSVGEEIYYSELAENKTYSQEDADKMLKDFHGQPGFSNVNYVRKMKKPSLWVFGGKDVSIPAKQCISTLESIRDAGHLPIHMQVYPEANHGIFNETTNQMEDYMSRVVEFLKNVR